VSRAASIKAALLVACCYAMNVQVAVSAPSLQNVRALYGFSPRYIPKKHRRHRNAAARWLKRQHFNAVFARPTPKLVRELSAAKIAVYVEFPVFVGYRRWKSNPRLRPITSEGNPMRKSGWYGGICPCQQAFVRARLRRLAALVKRTPVDGVWLDFIRFPARWEKRSPKLQQSCFCKACISKMRLAGVLDGLPASLESTRSRARWILVHRKAKLARWKSRLIAKVIKRARAIIKRHRPRALVGAFVVPWNDNEHDGAITAVLGQDIALMAKQLDVLSPMLYHRMLGKNVRWIHESIKRIERRAKRPIVPVVQSCSIPSKLSNAELKGAIRQARRAPSRGVILFSHHHFAREKRASTWRSAGE
jgi:hypothetical protein